MILKFTLLFFVQFFSYTFHVDGGSIKMSAENTNGNFNHVQIKNSGKQGTTEQAIPQGLRCKLQSPTNWTLTACNPPAENCQLYTYPLAGYSSTQMDTFCCVANPTAKLNIRVIQANTEAGYDYVGITNVLGATSYRFDLDNVLPDNVQTSHIVCVVFSSDSDSVEEINPAGQVQISMA